MTSRATRTVLAVLASAAVLAASPGFVGIAAAHDNGSSQGSSDALKAPNPDLRTAIKDARSAFFTSTQKTKGDYRDSLVRIRTSIQAETAPALSAVKAAKTSYDAAAGSDQATLDTLRAALKSAIDAYRAALVTVKTTHGVEIAAAAKAATDAVTAAGAAYTKAVTDAFAKYAPGTAPPAGLLLPPGHGFSNGQGSGHGDQGLHLSLSKGTSGPGDGGHDSDD